jgi:peptide/nickel transport system substrate-binding protein
MFRRSPALASFTLAALLAAAACNSTAATSAMFSKALYDTLPSVATSYTSSDDARRFAFKLRRNIVFSDGDRLTSADVVFSLERLAKLKGAASGLLSGVSASAPDAYTIVLTSNDPNPELLSSLTNPALAIVSSSMALLQPGRVIVTTADIAKIDYRPTWSVDLAAVTG